MANSPPHWGNAFECRLAACRHLSCGFFCLRQAQCTAPLRAWGVSSLQGSGLPCKQVQMMLLGVSMLACRLLHNCLTFLTHAALLYGLIGWPACLSLPVTLHSFANIPRQAQSVDPCCSHRVTPICKLCKPVVVSGFPGEDAGWLVHEYDAAGPHCPLPSPQWWQVWDAMINEAARQHPALNILLEAFFAQLRC